MQKEKKTEFETAFHHGASMPELNKIYAELKAIQQEIIQRNSTGNPE